MNRYAIKNATVVNEGISFAATVFILGDTIERISEDPDPDTSGYETIEASGKYLLPGVIDTHVHFREPGLTYKGDFSSESHAAVAGGVTSIVDMPNTVPQTTSMLCFDEKCNIASQNALTNYSFYVGASNENIRELLTLDPSKVFGIKIFMGSSTGDMLVDDDTVLKEIFKNSPLPIVTHCEDETIIRRNSIAIRQQYGNNPPFSVHPLIRTTEACYRSSQKAVELASRYGTRLHIAHLSTEQELSLLDNKGSLKDKRITAEACIQYLWFTDKDYAAKGAEIKCNPAIKSEKDRNALREAVHTGLIDTVATDHAPHTYAEKRQPYFLSPGGIPLIQHSLAAMLHLVRDGIFSIETVVRKMSHNPAMIFNIEKRGFIREGYYADMTLVDLDHPWMAEKNNILYKCGWSPFEGTVFASKILRTFVNGYSVWNNGEINDDIKGKQITFNR